MYTKTLTFKLITEGPEYEAICKGLGQAERLTVRGSGCEKLYDPAGSPDGVPVLGFSEIRLSNALGFLVQKIQSKTPSKDIDIELNGEVADKVLNYYQRNPDKKYKLVLAPTESVL